MTVITIWPSTSPGGIFAATIHLGARFSCYFLTLFKSWTKLTRGSSLLIERPLLMEKSKTKESP